MTYPTQKAPLYPKSHLLAASGVAALLSLALLVFPSREVEAKKSFIDLKLEYAAEQILEENTESREPTPSLAESPFGNEAAATDPANEANAQAEPAAPAVDESTKRLKVANGDTLSTLFSKAGLPSAAVHDVLASSKDAKQIAQLKVGQELVFDIDEQGQLRSLSSRISPLQSLMIEKTDSGYAFKKEQIKPDVQTRYAHGEIASSLFLAAKHAGLSHNLTMDLANIFGYDIDFALDIRQGDSFDVVYEEKIVDGRRVGTGNILAARFVNRGKTYTAVRYTGKNGTTSYYTADGSSMRKAFIRTPVDFARISSRFSNGRKHPILNKIRAHKGVDYAAPHGTPIKSSGDGKVLLAGRKGGYGNTVIIQHGNRYRTLYAHMQGFAKGVRNGAAVKQGQIIGYIGTTGLSTGPHLHYEFQVDGVHVDPLGLKLPMADPIAKSELPRFLAASRPLMARMDEERASMLALKQD
ncbi:peptidoglycan DD-metalloendopeptidase family protein [Pseudomonas oligotrophica]|uniref:peptidoglycan DD-metalloendopeptidase family protein n=1 Tax=Pseudomonas oligotrophica TaxID=2912055 RepID=UPI001F1A3172|nr:peptidoglycan DD-metalloendopeptidase family protein [Pseudomonas oligotrophica]MCF7201219.1 peptidoglycan DD-metalloendopeptidase family protein [Pseudomonas oligotrophica]